MNIKPKYINGEPVCSGEECDQYHDDFPHWWVCLVLNKTITKGLTCIPGLRRDRDQAIKERDESLSREKALKEWNERLNQRLAQYEKTLVEAK